MNDPRLVQLLAACGMAESELESLLTSSEDASPRYRALQNPKAADELACALAVEAARSTPNRVLIWAGVDDTLLAFVVARELECEVSVVWQSEGLLCCDPEIAVGDRVLIVSACFIETSRLEALRSLVALRGAAVAAVASLIETEVLRDGAGGEAQPLSLFRPRPDAR